MENTIDRSPGICASYYKPLSDGDVKTIAGEALRILEKSGMLVYSERAREAFKKNGAEVNDDTCLVKLPRGLVEDAVATNPSSVTLYSRNGKCDAVLEKNRVHFGTGGTAIYVLDPDTGERRPSTIEDVILAARNEILGMCRRVLKGIEVNDSTLAADLIIEKGPGNNFLDSEHTIKYMRDEFFIPEISVRDKRTAGNDSGNALSKAKRIVQEVRLKRGEAFICSPLRDKILKTFPEIIKKLK